LRLAESATASAPVWHDSVLGQRTRRVVPIALSADADSERTRRFVPVPSSHTAEDAAASAPVLHDSVLEQRIRRVVSVTLSAGAGGASSAAPSLAASSVGSPTRPGVPCESETSSDVEADPLPLTLHTSVPLRSSLAGGDNLLPLHLQTLVAQWNSSEIPRRVLGRNLILDVETNPSRGPPYARVKVSCNNPAHRAGGLRCGRSRHLRFSENFGIKEVFGYLSAWLDASSTTEHGSGQSSHMAYHPTLEDVRVSLYQRQLL